MSKNQTIRLLIFSLVAGVIMYTLYKCEQEQKKRAQIEAEARQNEHNKLFTTLDSDAIETKND
jgi:hypothetical protein